VGFVQGGDMAHYKFCVGQQVIIIHNPCTQEMGIVGMTATITYASYEHYRINVHKRAGWYFDPVCNAFSYDETWLKKASYANEEEV
jgi:hypothetical protein